MCRTPGAVRPHGRKLRRRELAAKRAKRSRSKNDRRKRRREGEDRHERRRGDRPQRRRLERSRADAPCRMQHDGGDRGLDAVEHSGDGGHLSVGHVYPRQRDQNEERRQDEQRAGDDPAPGAVHEPADVGGELLRLGTGQHHAVVEGVQEAALGDPVHALDQVVMHDRDLPRRSAEAYPAELPPVAKRCCARRCHRRHVRINSRFRRGGQLWPCRIHFATQKRSAAARE